MTNPVMNIERMEEGKTCLREVIRLEKQFDMNCFIPHDEYDDYFSQLEAEGVQYWESPSLPDSYPELREFCNTPCCALGNFALWEEFNKQGLTIDGEFQIVLRGFDLDEEAQKYKEGYSLSSMPWTEELVAMKFFGLTFTEARFLFNPCSSPCNDIDTSEITPHIMIERMDKVLAGDFRGGEV